MIKQIVLKKVKKNYCTENSIKINKIINNTQSKEESLVIPASNQR